MLPQVALVAIGRNEGERLRGCLESVLGRVALVVYVDSGSTDGSVGMSRSRGVEVVELDIRQPFTAARARNAGFQRVRDKLPGVRYVQFVDGDCEVVGGWLEAGVALLEARYELAAVCGQRRERHPERSIYNRLCDMDWNQPPGPARYFGGDVMIRAEALQRVHGYREDLIAGEEPELCVRLRAQGWKLHALDLPMTLHDAAMTRFGQWWKRTVRTGYAYAEGARLHGAPPERHWVRPLRSALMWGLALPAAVLVGMAAFGLGAALLLAIYPLQVLRLAARGEGPWRTRLLRAVFLVTGKFPEAQGALRFFRLAAVRRPSRLIEYK